MSDTPSATLPEEALAFLDEQDAIIMSVIGEPRETRLRNGATSIREIRMAAAIRRPLSDLYVGAFVEAELRFRSYKARTTFDRADCDKKVARILVLLHGGEDRSDA